MMLETPVKLGDLQSGEIPVTLGDPQSGCYIFTNLIDGKKYVGQSRRLDKRIAQHFRKAENGHGDHVFALHRAMRKHGCDNFTVTRVYVEGEESRQEVERELIRDLRTLTDDNGYNMTEGGVGGRGRLSEEYKKKISDANQGREVSPETRRKLSDANRGKELSPEHKKKIGDANRGKKKGPPSPEHRRNLSESLRGRELSPEHIRNLSESLRGREFSPEHTI